MLGHMVHHFLDSTKSYDLFNLSFKNKLNSKTIILDITNQKKLLNKIEEIDPDIIFCPHPTLDKHPTHRKISEIILENLKN